jgi:hypothetical protein
LVHFQRARESRPFFLVARNAEAEPIGMIAEAANENSGPPEPLEDFAGSLARYQAKQQGAPDKL